MNRFTAQPRPSHGFQDTICWKEVEVEFALGGEADELPLVGEATMIAVAEVIEDDPSRFADAASAKPASAV